MTVAEEYVRFGLAATAANEPKFHVEIYHPKKKTGSKGKWARPLTVAFNYLSLRTWYPTVFAGLPVVADGNNLYRFRTQMYAIGQRSQRHFGTRALRPLPQRPVLELPDELQANETDREEDVDDACRANGACRRNEPSEDDDDACGVVGSGLDRRRRELSDDEDGAHGVGAVFNRRYEISDDEDDAGGAGSGFDLRCYEISDDQDDTRGIGAEFDCRYEISDDEDDTRGVGCGFDCGRRGVGGSALDRHRRGVDGSGLGRGGSGVGGSGLDRCRCECWENGDDARAVGSAFDRRYEILDDEDDARGVGCGFDCGHRGVGGSALDRHRRGVEGCGLDRARLERSQDGNDARGLGAAFDCCRTKLEEAMNRASHLRFAGMMDNLKEIVGSFHDQCKLWGHAKLQEILSNKDADAAERLMQKFGDNMLAFQADFNLQMEVLLEDKLAYVSSM
ncbi:hypothetical protein FN846DRAFT_896733 [Sphaerosporella brunnea]|uniref:Uncharacterized protein n=1 Tax=Sphaerosporella brunnea TaxID=1250544 RepID=A0A5J5EBJ8_9PEZI|nr:hypothetical protein FN846DRAFT_896733 [Sphaerosporella brunnea]